MDNRMESNSPTKELETFLKKDSVSAFEITDGELCTFDGVHATKDGKGKHETLLKESPTDVPDSSGNIEIRLWKNKICINKYLIPLRIAQFLLFGAGRLPSVVLFVLLKQRGLTLVELSSAFTFIFLAHTSCCYVCGIVADKIGNAKPVLIFLIFATSSMIVCIMLAPNIEENSCPPEGVTLKFSSNFEGGQNLTSDIVCPKNNKKNKAFEESSEYTDATVTAVFQPEHAFENFSDYSGLNVTNISNSGNYSNPCQEKPPNDCHTQRTRTVAIYYALILCFFSFWCTTFLFMDFAAISLANKYGSHFGKERFVAYSGDFFIFILASFAFVFYSSPGVKYNYESVLWISVSGMLLAAVSVFSIRAPVIPPGSNLTRKALTLVRDTDVLAFFVVVFVAGNGYCFNMNFNLWFLQSLGATKTLISFHQLTHSVYAFPVLLTSSWWLRKFGSTKLFVLAMLCYAMNNISYSFLYDPWLSLIIEFTVPFSYHVFWIAVVEHGQKIAPVGFGATVNAIAGAFHFGIGRSSGVVIGGFVTNYLGIRVAYRIMATSYLVIAILYSIFLYRRQSLSTNEHEVNGKHTEVTTEIRMENGDIQEI